MASKTSSSWPVFSFFKGFGIAHVWASASLENLHPTPSSSSLSSPTLIVISLPVFPQENTRGTCTRTGSKAKRDDFVDLRCQRAFFNQMHKHIVPTWQSICKLIPFSTDEFRCLLCFFPIFKSFVSFLLIEVIQSRQSGDFGQRALNRWACYR